MITAIFCLGVFAVIAQVIFTREILVAFLGNELAVGTVLACWLAGIGAGSISAVRLQKLIRGFDNRRRVLAAILVLAAAAFPLQVYTIRAARLLASVPAGEYPSFAVILATSLLVLLPTCWVIGVFFPMACEMMKGRERANPVGRLYWFESAGSMLGGAILTFLLLPRLETYSIVLIASLVLLAGACMLAVSLSARLLATAAIAAIAAGLFVYPGWIAGLAASAVNKRWESFGVTGPREAGSPAVRLVTTRDTMYQNLAVTESDGQFNLFGNGRILFSFPDKSTYEHSIHFLMAQNPAAKRVLLLGGNPVGDIPELLKYPLERLVYVELDPELDRIAAGLRPGEYARTEDDPRVVRVVDDGVRYVSQCAKQFDVVIVNAPEPATASANRYYTKEFYLAVRRILSPSGFMYTSVSSSERLQGAAVDLGASVYKTIRAVFPRVLVTAEVKNRFFAGSEGSKLTFDREVLEARSSGASIEAKYWKPVYFLGADEISPEKVENVTRRFESAVSLSNTVLRPMTYFYNLQLWFNYSGSGGVGLLKSLETIHVEYIAACLLLAGLVGAVTAGIFMRRAGHAGSVWTRVMYSGVAVTVGFTGIALEIILIFLFQSFYGYVYAKLGLIFAAFMLGLAMGAPAGSWFARRATGRSLAVFVLLEICVIGMAAGIPVLTGSVSEYFICVAVGFAGWITGAEFMLLIRLVRDAGAGNSAVAVVNAFDLAGAACGAFIAGVFLIPVAGIPASCGLLAALKLSSIVWLMAPVLSRRKK